MKVVGLTGNIATGKSAVLRMLAALGARTLDADAVVHQLLRKGGEAYRPVVEAFGPGILRPDGEIDRARLAAVVFPDPAALARLEAVLYPHVEAAVDAWLQGLREQEKWTQLPGPPVVAVIDAVKLLESKLVDLCDQVWVVVALPEQRLGRMVKLRRMDEQAARPGWPPSHRWRPAWLGRT